jgi:hypothetical protein
VNVRYIPAEQLPEGTRTFKPTKNHKTWGNRVQPLGCWRIKPTTRTIIVVEGLFDMLITAQKIRQQGRDTDTVAVYTNGASPAAKILRDPDEAGREWATKLLAAIRKGGANVRALRPPDSLDPDEAILRGWWNVGI